jgi:anti-sigma regulatory factor (Ser/Thr protein kinase)
MSVEASRLDAGDSHRHRVAFYRRDSDLVEIAASDIAEALQQGDTAVVIATPAHRRAFKAAIQDRLDAGAAVAERRLVMLDAAETMAGFIVDGAIDPERFDGTVGELVRQSIDSAFGLFAYGEMVALLWKDGRRDLALELERRWGELLAAHDFTLLCAYPKRVVSPEQDPEGYVNICATHTAVVAGPPIAPDAEIVRYFPATLASPRLARQFVRETLAEWGLSHLTDDCALIATELATNALRHGRSDFTISIGRSGQGAWLAVGDSAGEAPKPQRAERRAKGGRGLHLVASTARSWGHRPRENGKLVWAELGDTGGVAPDHLTDHRPA